MKVKISTWDSLSKKQRAEIDEYIKFVEENPDETDDEIKLLIKNILTNK